MLSRDFKEFVALPSSTTIEYLVVGGYAMALHGRPRHTGDLDIWIRRSPENAQRLMVALSEFGFGDVGLSQQDFELPQNVIQLGYPPFRIDLLTDIDGVDFDAAWPNRETTIHDGLTLHFVGLADLKANKRASGRPRDIDDLEQLP
ncbi:MAG: hypothetical protein Q8O52_29005 [Sulfuritalea sp.]|nr:hypothetical protein [Sulfuritalea sp.]